MSRLFGQHTWVRQGRGDLGARLKRAMAAAFRVGAKRLVVIGSDCPALNEARIVEALEHLQSNDVVLGPATDGGYYLIGLSRPFPSLFDGISWGADRVLNQTLAAVACLGLNAHLLEPLSDVDTSRDLRMLVESAAPHIELSQCERAVSQGLISIIIPTLDESAHLGRTLERLKHGLEGDTSRIGRRLGPQPMFPALRSSLPMAAAGMRPLQSRRVPARGLWSVSRAALDR